MANQRPYPSFLIYKDEKSEYRWRYQASNAKIIADSGEGYKTKKDCMHGIALMQASGESPTWQTAEVEK